MIEAYQEKSIDFLHCDESIPMLKICAMWNVQLHFAFSIERSIFNWFYFLYNFTYADKFWIVGQRGNSKATQNGYVIYYKCILTVYENGRKYNRHRYGYNKEIIENILLYCTTVSIISLQKPLVISIAMILQPGAKTMCCPYMKEMFSSGT